MNGLFNTFACLSARVTLTHIPSGTCLIELYGELDNISYGEISVFIDAELTDADKAVIVDFSNLSFADSSGPKLLSGLRNRFGADNCTIYGVSSNVRRILDFTSTADKIVVTPETDGPEYPKLAN